MPLEHFQFRCEFYKFTCQKTFSKYQLFSIIMMWAVTIAILWSAILAAVYRRPVMGETYVVTSAALFALPEVRDKLPGGPEFGTLSDSLGYFLCLPIVSASIAVLLFCMLYRK